MTSVEAFLYKNALLSWRTALTNEKIITSLSLAVQAGFLTISAQAGQEVYKQVAPQPPPPMYGLGFYGAIDAGANVYQNRGGDRTFTDDNPNSQFFGSTLKVEPEK